jgi:HemY protein
MRKLFILLLALVLSVAAALWLNQQGGFVLVSLGEWTLQTSVILFVGAILALLVAVYLLVGLLRQLFGVPRRLRGWSRSRKQRQARVGLTDGLIRLAEGRPAEAEKRLLKYIDRSEAPLLHYLAMAVSAQQRGSYEDRDRFLADADRVSPRARLAVGLIQAQLQVEAAQWEQALATLNYLQELAPRNPRVLSMLLKCCLALNEWERLDRLLPELKRQGVVDEARAQALARQVAEQRLRKAQGTDLVTLEQAWNGLSKAQREDPELALLYIDGLIGFGSEDEAERVLRARLQKDWQPSLVQRYGALKPSEPEKAFAQTEKWLKERPDDALLLYVAGRQALRAKLWGRARLYFEASLGRLPSSQAYHALGALLENMGELDAARECYRKAIETVSGDLPLEALSESERQALVRLTPRQEPSERPL